MKRALVSVLALCVVVLAGGGLGGCSKKEIKPPSLSSKMALEAYELSGRLRDAYVGNNKKALEKLSTPDGYRALISAIKKFDKAELQFRNRRVEIRDDEVKLTVAWSGVWTLRGKVTEKKGTAVLRFDGRPLRFTGLEKGNPFIYP